MGLIEASVELVFDLLSESKNKKMNRNRDMLIVTGHSAPLAWGISCCVPHSMFFAIVYVTPQHIHCTSRFKFPPSYLNFHK